MLVNNSKDGLLQPSMIGIYDALPVSTSIVSLENGKILYTNSAFQHLYGCTANSFKNIHEFIDAVCVEDQRKEMHLRLEDAFRLNQKNGVTPLNDVEVDVQNLITKEIHSILLYGIIMHSHGCVLSFSRDISIYKRSQRTLKRAASHDPLTGLANRRGLNERLLLEISSTNKRPLAFFAIDLDNFKPVNDKHGHDTGDDVLQNVSSRLKSIMRENDLVCRLGGDEFAILTTKVQGIEQLGTICERIVTTLNEPIKIMNTTVQIAASVGCCLYPDHAKNAKELVRNADAAMYMVKRAEKGGWRIWGQSSEV